VLHALFLSILAASSAGTELLTPKAENAAFDRRYQMTGRYRYVDGDRFFYACGGTVCVDTLVRDQYLQQHVNELNGKIVTIIVRRIETCTDPHSSQVACVRSSGTGFEILRWVDPAAP
jgi:hypothetical protein